MNTSKHITFGVGLYLLLSSLGSPMVYSQDSKTDETQSIAETRSYIFKVQSVSPRRGGMIQQSPGYDVIVRTDTVISNLPYIGRAYQASYGSSDAGIKFISTKFEYSMEEKKNKLYVKIKPKDARSVAQMIFTIYDNGTASLSVISNDRETISYNGYVEKRNTK